MLSKENFNKKNSWYYKACKVHQLDKNKERKKEIPY